MALGLHLCLVLVLVSSWAVSIVCLAGVLTWCILHLVAVHGGLGISYFMCGSHAQLFMTWSCHIVMLVMAGGLGSCGWPSTLQSERGSGGGGGQTQSVGCWGHCMGSFTCYGWSVHW